MHRLASNVEEQLIVKAIEDEVSWESLPKRLKLFLASKEDWHRRIKEHCIKKRLRWNECHARNACKEGEYYEELMRYLRKSIALFPYHLSENVCRIMRVTPFRYYCDMVYEIMKNEKPYDSIPNFTAADVLRLTGIGRNEFIDIMNKCRAKRLMWKVNKSIVKEMLPTVPIDFPIEAWWIVSFVNLTLEEYRKLTETEMLVVNKVSKDQINLFGELDSKVVRGLYRKGLVYLDVPVFPDDRFKVLNLEGFVSNREQSYEDPIEEILYAVFVASSERSSISELATTLQLDLSQLEAAVSLACRLGWASKVLDPSALLNEGQPNSPLGEGSDTEDIFSVTSPTQSPRVSTSDSGDVFQAKFIRAAFLVDATLTSYLMMGSFSPGLKAHAVTLYEAGKLVDTSIPEFCNDLKALESTKLEGELQTFVNHALSLRYALDCIRSGGTSIKVDEECDIDANAVAKGYPKRNSCVDVLRCESLASLTSGTLQRIFQRDYNLIVSMIPLTSPPLVRTHKSMGPVHFGPPSRAAMTPWMKLLLYTVFEAGPVSVVLMAGLRLRLLPPPLAGCSKALVWTWDGSTFAGIGGKLEGSSIPGVVLLHALNSVLRYSAVLVQPFAKDSIEQEVTVDIPLPLRGDSFEEIAAACGEDKAATYRAAADELSLSTAGYLRFLRVGSSKPDWVPQGVELGMPLFDTELCRRVCEAVVSTELLQQESMLKHREDMQRLKNKLHGFIADYQASGSVSMEVYTSKKQESGAAPSLQVSSSSRWNPFRDNIPELESPSSATPKDPRRRRRRSEILSFDGDILRTFSLVPVYQAKHGSSNDAAVAATAAAAAAPSPRASEALDDFEIGEVPLPGVNLLFDGASLLPLDIGSCLQARLAPALVARAALQSA